MKKFFTFLAGVVGLVLLANTASFAQASATANSSATIVAPIAISKTTDMSFGNIALGQSSPGGTVILTTAGARTPSGSGVVLPSITGTVAAASFAVTGYGNSTYSITLPSTATLNGSGTASGNTMTIGTFTSSPSSTGTLTSGAQTLLVGATLTVGSTQVAGPYSGSFSVSVNYN